MDQCSSSDRQLRVSCGRLYSRGSAYRTNDEFDYCRQHHEKEQDSLQVIEDGRDSWLRLSDLL